MTKYVKVTVSSNFGNIFSVLAASLLLPFLPMSAVQLLLLNLVYDLTCTAIPWDSVDDDLVRAPRRWDSASIRRFMVSLGPVSSVFDLLTFAALFFVVCPGAAGGPWGALDDAGRALFVATFQAGWLVEDLGSKNGSVLVSGADHSRRDLELGVAVRLRPADELVLAGSTTFVAIEGLSR